MRIVENFIRDYTCGLLGRKSCTDSVLPMNAKYLSEFGNQYADCETPQSIKRKCYSPSGRTIRSSSPNPYEKFNDLEEGTAPFGVVASPTASPRKAFYSDYDPSGNIKTKTYKKK